MKYDIKLYVHGVPKGQCSWGVGNLDSNYIDTFYGRKSAVPAQMFAEIRQFGSSAFSYYTYYVSNTSDNDGRTGGYFALTLRINYYYADIQNIYNLLDAAFNKFIAGTVVKAASGVFKYVISDFSQVDINLNALEQEINKYLMQFSSDSDFVSLNGFKANGQNEAVALNLLECDSKTVANHVKTHSSISISPYHPSTHEKQIIDKMNAEINATKTEAKQQIAAAQQNARRDMEATRNQAQKDVDDARHEKEIGIQKIKNEYKNADRTINNLREELKKAKAQNVCLTEQVNAALAKVHDSLSGLGNIANQGMHSNSSSIHVQRGGSKQKECDHGSSFKKIVRDIHPFTDLFVMIVLLMIICFALPKSCDGSEKERNAANKQMEQFEKQLENQLEKIQNASKSTPLNTEDIDADAGTVEKRQPTLKERFPKAWIDVAGIGPDKPMRYGSGDTYTVSLKNVEGDLGGVWKSNDFAIYNENLTPKHPGSCTISYVVNGEELVTRTIKVEE